MFVWNRWLRSYGLSHRRLRCPYSLDDFVLNRDGPLNWFALATLSESMNRKEAPQQLLERLPKKWALAIVVALIGYVLLQPMLNSRFGWKLPSLAGLSGNEAPQVIQGKTPDRASTKARSTASNSVVEDDSSEVEASESDSLRDDKPDDSQPQKTQPEKTQPKKTQSKNSQSGQEPRDAVEQADPDQPTSKQPPVSSLQASNLQASSRRVRATKVIYFTDC